MRKPQPAILTIWRLELTLLALIPAFANSIVFSIGGRVWLWITLSWVVVYLFFFLFYMPVRYKKLSFEIHEDHITLYSGVFYTRKRTLPIASIQYTGMNVSPLHRFWHLGTLILTAPGGRLILPGLARADAESLASMLPGNWRESH